MKPKRLDSILESIGSERRIRYGLEGVLEALRRTGNPEKSVHTLVIGGTNGKGTTSLLLSAALVSGGFRVATFLSPHLQAVSERFLWNMSPAPSPELDELAAELESTGKELALTYFEFLTLLFFHWARRKGAEFLVLEVGLGGRLDATNVTQPIATAITNISYDHQAYLGSTLELILQEKLGIVRPEGLVFTGVREPRLMEMLEKRCAELDAIYYYSHELKVEEHGVSWAGQDITINGYPFHLANPSRGTTENAALSFLLLRIIFPRLPISTIQSAFKDVRTPGRLEVVQESPRIVLSGDHNPAGIDSLKASLRRLPTGKVHTICGFSPDKPAEEMSRSLSEISASIDKVEIGTGAVHSAIERATARAQQEDTVLVTGSLYLVAEARSRWRSACDFLDTSTTST